MVYTWSCDGIGVAHWLCYHRSGDTFMLRVSLSSPSRSYLRLKVMASQPFTTLQALLCKPWLYHTDGTIGQRLHPALHGAVSRSNRITVCLRIQILVEKWGTKSRSQGTRLCSSTLLRRIVPDVLLVHHSSKSHAGTFGSPTEVAQGNISFSMKSLMKPVTTKAWHR